MDVAAAAAAAVEAGRVREQLPVVANLIALFRLAHRQQTESYPSALWSHSAAVAIFSAGSRFDSNRCSVV